MIPSQLQKEEFRFLLLPKNKKHPPQSGWTTDSSFRYKFNDEKLLKHLAEGGNYAVAGCFGDLNIIDSDTYNIPDLAEAVRKFFPKTFTVKTTSGGEHFYYIIKGCNKKIIFKNKDKKEAGSIQSLGTYVVGPNCSAFKKLKNVEEKYITSNELGTYEIIDQSPIAEISLDDLHHLHDIFSIQLEEKNEEKKTYIKSAIDLIPLDKILNLSLLKLRSGHSDEYIGPNPWHGSTTGNNFQVQLKENICHCWSGNCGRNITPIKAIALNEKIIETCIDELKGEKFKQAVEVAKQKYGYKEPEKTYEKHEVDSMENLRLEVLQCLAQKVPDRDQATELVVEWIENNKKIFSIRDDVHTETWIYQGGIYVPNGKTYIDEICREVLQSQYTTHFFNRVTSKIQADTYIDMFEFFQRKSKDSIAVQNGYLNIFTRELRDYDPKEIFFEKFPVHYDPEADCPNFKKHIRDVVKYDSDFPLMQEILGHLLYNDYRFEVAVMFSGDGENGKGKTCNTIVKFLGEDNVSGVSLEAICKETFSRSELLNKRANICGEVNNEILENTEWFKKLTGRDYVQANRKGLPYIKFYNNAKMIFNLNEMPRSEDQTDGFFRRWIIIEFPFKFLPSDQIERLSEEEKKFAKVRDTQHINKMTTQEELNGILNFALDGVVRLQKNDKFSYSKSISEVRQIWNRKADSFLAFCEEFVEEDYESKIPKESLRQKYAQYCKKHKVKSTEDKYIRKILLEKYGVSDRQVRLDNNSYDKTYVWIGIRLKNEEVIEKYPEGISKQEKNIEKNDVIQVSSWEQYTK